MKRKKFIIDGSKIKDLDSFYTEAGKVLCPNFKWGRNLNAFDDILRGGFESFEYEEPIDLVWKDAEISKKVLGYQETVRQLRRWLIRSYINFNFSAIKEIKKKIRQAKQGLGPTIYDWIIEIIQDNKNINLEFE